MPFPTDLEEVFAYFEAQPWCVNELHSEGEPNETFIHFLVELLQEAHIDDVREVLPQILSVDGVDFMRQGAETGNSPLHLAALHLYPPESTEEQNSVSQQIFEIMLHHAALGKFDFSLQNRKGQTIFHLVAIYSNGECNNLLKVLGYTDNSSLDSLTVSGATAFFYVINHGHYEEAFTLLDAGANPFLYGSIERCPIAALQKRKAHSSDKRELNIIKKLEQRIQNTPFARNRLDTADGVSAAALIVPRSGSIFPNVPTSSASGGGEKPPNCRIV